MATALRKSVCDKKPTPILHGEIECDEMYVVAGHKGNPEAVQRANRQRRPRGGRGALDKEKPPLPGMIERGGEVVISLLPNVRMRGISQEKLPLYLGFFELAHNVRRRGKALLSSLIGLLVAV